MVSDYPFDVLPIHPPPYPLESLSSYVTRLAVLNGIPSFQALARTLLGTNFPHKSRLPDAPPYRTEAVAQATHCSVERVLECTFFYLADKFGRTGIRNFIVPSVASTLRYCSLCLTEQCYYRLHWRFTSLVGCPIHRCALLDCCPHCTQSIPLFAQLCRVGTCPYCQHDLRLAQPIPLHDDQLASVQRRQHDLAYLLTPATWQGDGVNIRRSIGPYLKYLRTEQHLLERDLLVSCEVSKAAGGALEQANHTPCGNHFSLYLRYADALGTNWETIFRTLEHDFQHVPCHARQMRMQSLLVKTQTAIQTLRETKSPVTIVAICKLVGMTSGALCRYPDIDALLRPIVEAQHNLEHKQQRADQLLAATRAAVDWLLAHKKSPTWAAVAQRVGVNARTLSQAYPAIKAWMQNVNGRASVQPRREQRQSAFLQAVHAIVQRLTDEGQPISLRKVASLMNVTPGMICTHYPDVQRYLNEVSARQKASLLAARDTELLEQVEAAILSMEAQQLPVTQKTVAHRLGFSRNSLTYYPRVAACLKTIAGRSNSARYKRFLRKNDMPQPR